MLHVLCVCLFTKSSEFTFSSNKILQLKRRESQPFFIINGLKLCNFTRDTQEHLLLVVLYSQNYAAGAVPWNFRLFWILETNPYLNHATQKIKIFPPKKLPELKISNTQKSFDHPITWSPEYHLCGNHGRSR